MRNITVRIMVLALLFGLVKYAVAEPDPQTGKVTMKSMTVAELEKAGDESRAQKDYRQAMQYFQAALNKEPKNAVVYNKMGMTALKVDDLRSARYYFQRAAKLNPKYAEALNNIGAVEFTQRNYGAAAKYFKKAVALQETSATFHVNLGAAWFHQNKLEGAIAEYARALELDPYVLTESSRVGSVAQASTPEERAKYSYMLAKIYARQGKVDECLRCLRRAKEEGYHDLANVYKDEEFASLRGDARLSEVIAPPAAK